jgi:hypothetical protein
VKWDIESPKFGTAMFNLGIIKEDIELKGRDDFSGDYALVKVRFKHHRKIVMELINDIIKERNKIKVE